MKKSTYLIFATVVLLAQQTSGAYAQAFCNQSPPNCGPGASGYSCSSYTYCILGDKIVSCDTKGAQPQPGSCCLCTVNEDQVCDSGFVYTIYNESKTFVLYSGTCTNPGEGCPSVPCQNEKSKKQKSK